MPAPTKPKRWLSAAFITALCLQVSGFATAQTTKQQDAAFEAAMQAQMQRSRELMQRVTPSQAAQSMPNIPTPAASGVDPAQMIDRFNQAQKTSKSKDEGLVVFVSLSMPAASLESLIQQAERYGFALILRGFVNDSLRETTETIQNLIGKRNVEFQIDPRLFTRFAIKQVPTTVVVSAASNRYAAVEGDVTIGYALEQIASSKSTVAPLARHYLRGVNP